MNPILIEQILQLLLGEFLTLKANDAANAPFIAAISAARAANLPVAQLPNNDAAIEAAVTAINETSDTLDAATAGLPHP
jgi:hypothetical protein